MSNTKKILKDIASSAEYKDLTDAITQVDYEVIFDSYMNISKLISSGKEKIEEGFEHLPPRSKSERLDKFRQSFDLAVERTLPLWHQLNQALIKGQIMEGEVFSHGKKGDPLVRTPEGILVALRGSKLEEGNRVRFIIVYEGEKISIGKVFDLNPQSFYTVITQESRERVKHSLAAIEDHLKSSQDSPNEDSLPLLEELLGELEEITKLPSIFRPEERQRIIAQALRYRNRLLYDFGIRLMFESLSEQEEKGIETFYEGRPEDKNKAMSALGLFRRHSYEAAEKLLSHDKPEEYGQSFNDIEDEIDSMESAMKIMDYRASIDRAYPKAQSYLEKMNRLFNRLTKKVGQVIDAMPENGMVKPDEIQLVIKDAFNEDSLFFELRKTFKSSKDYFSQRSAFSELIKKLGDQESIAAENAFRSYLDYKIPQAFDERR